MPEQARRPEYFYPTRAEVKKKMEKLHQRQHRLEAKREKRDEVKDVLLPEAREEYTNVLEDTRHPANKEAYSAEDLRRARDEARGEVNRCEKNAGQHLPTVQCSAICYNTLYRTLYMGNIVQYHVFQFYATVDY